MLVDLSTAKSTKKFMRSLKTTEDFISDEVKTGVGRLGKNFLVQRTGSSLIFTQWQKSW